VRHQDGAVRSRRWIVVGGVAVLLVGAGVGMWLATRSSGAATTGITTTTTVQTVTTGTITQTVAATGTAEPASQANLNFAVSGTVTAVDVTAGQTVATARTEWGGSRRMVPVVAERGAWLLGVPGQRMVAAMAPAAPSGARTGDGPAGAVRFTLGPQTETVPVRLLHRVPDPGWWWKVLHA